MDITVSGINIAQSGNDWFLIDESGEFTLDKTIMATIWLVGGGCDGGDGYIDSLGIFHGGNGGDGGAVYRFGKIKLLKNVPYSINIADTNKPFDTSFKLGQIVFKSEQIGCIRAFGGNGGIVNLDGGIVNPEYGKDGAITPYGYVGSSGSGGVCAAVSNGRFKSTAMSVGGVGAGNSRGYIPKGADWEVIKHLNSNIDAVNYGCGGGGNTYVPNTDDIDVKSRGKGGCVIVQFEVLENDGEDSPECSIRYWVNKK